MFDIIGFLRISSPGPLIPGGGSSKVVELWQLANHNNIVAASDRGVQKILE